MGKECSQLFSVLIISDVEEMEGLWVNASPAELSPGERRGEEAGQEGAEQREKKGWMRGEKRRGRWGQYAWRRRKKGREGWDGNEATGVPRTSRDQKVGRGAV